jgi:hypothetical protein
LQKQAYNALKRIAKLEELIKDTEHMVALLKKGMLVNGCNMEKSMELMERRDQQLNEQIASYMEEWEELEALLLTVAP